MSYIKTKAQANPFQGSLAQPQTVGRTYGERKTLKGSASAQSLPSHKSHDKFAKPAHKPANLASFDPRASYRTARSIHKGDFKPTVMRNLEDGATPVASKGQPSNEALLTFLGKIIENPVLHNPKNIRAAAFKGAPVQASRPKTGPEPQHHSRQARLKTS